MKKRIFSQIVACIFDRKSRVVLTDVGPDEINPQTPIAGLLDPFSLQQLLIKVESFFSIKIENQEVLAAAGFNGLPSMVIDPEKNTDKNYLTSTLGELTDLVVKKLKAEA